MAAAAHQSVSIKSFFQLESGASGVSRKDQKCKKSPRAAAASSPQGWERRQKDSSIRIVTVKGSNRTEPLPLQASCVAEELPPPPPLLLLADGRADRSRDIQVQTESQSFLMCGPPVSPSPLNPFLTALRFKEQQPSKAMARTIKHPERNKGKQRLC